MSMNVIQLMDFADNTLRYSKSNTGVRSISHNKTSNLFTVRNGKKVLDTFEDFDSALRALIEKVYGLPFTLQQRVFLQLYLKREQSND